MSARRFSRSIPVICRAIVLSALISTQSVAVLAQTSLDPDIWQDAANGLSVTMNDEQATGGLTMVIGSAGWPSLTLHGGVEDTGYDALVGPVGIDLGVVAVPGSATPQLASEDVNWAGSHLSFDATPSLDIWASRLSPAVVLQSEAPMLRLFNGAVRGNILDDGEVTGRPDSPAYPKYVAYVAQSGQQVQALSSSSLSLGDMSERWLLLWYGDNSHFVETKVPTSYSGTGYGTSTLPHSQAYQADAPLLLVFGTPPQSISHAEDGGVELSFATHAGTIAVQPLLGRDHPATSETETWEHGLPSSILERARWWQRRLCQFPTNVRETYAYERSSDTAVITESFEYLEVCDGGVRFAPIPPMLAIVYQALPVSFSGPVVDAKMATESGPVLGLENVSSYSWRVSQLNSFADARRVVLDAGMAPTELTHELAGEVDDLIGAGHLAPWVFSDSVPSRDIRGDIYWHTPGSVLYSLVEVGEVLDEPQRSQLQAYLVAEQHAYPAEYVANLPLDQGTQRAPFAIRDSQALERWIQWRPELFLHDAPLHNIYGLSRYHDFLSSTVSAEAWHAALEVLDRDMQEQDWATSYWFAGFDEQRIAVVNVNRHLAGLIGFLRMATGMGDTDAEALARCLFAKVVALRLALARYPRYLYESGLTELPTDPSWQVKFAAGKWWGLIFNYDWVDAYDDARQVVGLDQYGVLLHDHSGFGPCDTGLCSPYLVAYRDMTPELGRLLAHYAPEDSEVYLQKTQAIIPHWYASFGEGALGFEHNLSHPVDAYQLFMAEAWLESPTPETLLQYIDIPWLQAGDLHHMQKLAEAIRAYRGSAWSDTVALYASPGVSSVSLNWAVYEHLPADVTWSVVYEGPAGDVPSPISGLPRELRQYSLSGLENYVAYRVTVSAMQAGTVFVSSNTVTVTPRGATFLPIVMKSL